jgi:hypothetical protein
MTINPGPRGDDHTHDTIDDASPNHCPPPQTRPESDEDT